MKGNGVREMEVADAQSGAEEKKKPKILIVGDLFIDENWLMAKCDNYHSSNVGDFHYSSLLKWPDSLVLSLCGIAEYLKILGAQSEDNHLLHHYDLI